MARISVRVGDDEKRRLEAIARSEGVSESDLVREALVDYLGRHGRRESCLEVARRAGIVGCADGLPADLSTNRAHFEGFGGG